ncbi:MAG: hypothetical protein K1X67_13965 [Fimbriimonadaceae bacterium]|nr:hypothetical protein [Fimbriimonadaceae bacterium]
MHQTLLNNGWRLRKANADPNYHRPQLSPVGWIPATVPGNVHLDLVAAGIIPDPFARRYEVGAQWIDEADWTYECEFSWEPRGSSDRRVLRFEGLDTICRLFLNDYLIGESDNMFAPLDLDVTETLVRGTNTLRVEFSSAVRVSKDRRTAWFASHGLPQNFVMFDERAFVRKAGYMSGWDWGPRLVGAGIWKEVRLLEFTNRIEDVELIVEPQEDGRFRVRCTVETTVPEPVKFDFGLGSSETTVLGTEISDQHAEWLLEGGLWWPRGMGEQVLHTLEIRLESGDVQRRKFGLRTVEFKREADSVGESFEFFVNGKPVWARGANWIPNDSFPGRIRDGEIHDQIARFVELNMNMLRVWGGGLYESEAFYDACDELGVLVWQDFPYACMYYPDDKPWQEVARAEAEHHIKRLRHRASLALWCGNNENLVMFQTRWGGPGIIPDTYYGQNIYDRVLPDAVQRLDSGRSYIASSPVGMSPEDSIPIGPERNANMGYYGDSHYWDVWHGRGDWTYYRDSTTRFSSEFGFASSCSLAGWNLCLSGEDWHPFPNAVHHHHNKTGKPWDTFLGYVTLHYPNPETLEDWTYYSQLNQRDAMRFGVEFFRRSEICRGSLIWQANDCWPVQSWALQDYARVLKPAAFEMARAYADVMISIDYVADESEAQVWVVNDSLQPIESSLEMEVVNTLDGSIVDLIQRFVNLQANQRELVYSLNTKELDRSKTAVRFKLSGFDNSERWLLLAEPKETEVTMSPIEVRETETGLALDIRGFVADLVVWDRENLAAIQHPKIQQPGWAPMTAVNETLHYRTVSPIRHLRIRSLAGEHEVVWLSASQVRNLEPSSR